MIATFMLLLQAQTAHTATVGDTVWVTRRVSAPAGQTVRPADWQLTGDVELLGRPRVIAANGATDISYPLVAWTPGPHTVSIPGPLLLAPNGGIDSLPAHDTTFTVASVLPRGAADSSLRPQPQAGLIHRRTITLLPLLALLSIAALLLAPLHWWWQRRGRATAVPADLSISAPPLTRWAEAGESRIVLAAAAARIRHAVAAAVPAAHEGLDAPSLIATLERSEVAWPVAAVRELLQALDHARFSRATPRDVLELHAAATALAEQVRGAAAPPTMSAQPAATE
ncbi:MAG: hypothetical protein ABI637_02235 [Gemmatimonadota bacterium]